MGASNPYIVSTTKQARVPAPRGGRDSIFIQNNSGFTIYYSEDTPLTALTALTQGIQIGAGLYYAADQTQGKAVPQGTIFLLGSNAADQNIIVKEG